MMSATATPGSLSMELIAADGTLAPNLADDSTPESAQSMISGNLTSGETRYHRGRKLGDLELVTADGSLALLIADDSHTMKETHWPPGVYVGKGHAVLVGTNRLGETVNLAVMDLGCVISVGGVEVSDPDHLDAIGAYFRDRAQRMRQRRDAKDGRQ